MRTRTKNCAPDVVNRFRKLHGYIVGYWLKFQGPQNISVFDAQHKTNNITERLKYFFPLHLKLEIVVNLKEHLRRHYI